MSARRIAIVAAATLAALPLAARAQADNSNSVMGAEIAVVAWSARGDTAPLLRWLRENPRRRDAMHATRESLTAAELGLLYGTDFTFGAGVEGPVPVAAP